MAWNCRFYFLSEISFQLFLSYLFFVVEELTPLMRFDLFLPLPPLHRTFSCDFLNFVYFLYHMILALSFNIIFLPFLFIAHIAGHFFWNYYGPLHTCLIYLCNYLWNQLSHDLNTQAEPLFTAPSLGKLRRHFGCLFVKSVINHPKISTKMP